MAESAVRRDGGSAVTPTTPTPPRAPVPRPALPALVATLVAVAALALAACGGEADAPAGGGDWSRPVEFRQGQPVTATLVNSRLAVGASRLIFGLAAGDGSMIHDAASVELRLYALDDDDRGTLVREVGLRPSSLVSEWDHVHEDGSTHVHRDPIVTVWRETVDLTRAGWWGAELAVTAGGSRHEGLRIRFFVVEEGAEPAVGDAAPPTRQPVLADGRDIDSLSTAQPPNPGMHRLTVEEALALGRPVVVAFVTPAFCRTRYCGPVLEQVVTPVAERYSGRVEFVHIEPYDLERLRAEGAFVTVPAMEEWGLSTEPWVFVVDAEGRIAAKFEGVLSEEELDEALARLGA